jgi:hypothetical protein
MTMRTDTGSIYFFGPALMVQGYPDAHDLYIDLMAFLATLRPMKTNAIGRKYPETTIADVRQVIELFETRARAADSSEPEARAAVKRWRAYVNTVVAAVKLSPLSSGAAFPDNDRLWTQEARRLAIRLSAERSTRPDNKTLGDATKDSALNVLEIAAAGAGPTGKILTGAAVAVADAAKAVASGAASAAEDTARFVDKNLNPFSWARSMVGELKWPLIIGAAVVGGLVLLPRGGK